ncbi:MAG: hypothetical protein MUO19_04995, partial [Dehalococcoidales bacterium]|nr:hypothetical protein [Dehalococcoidales bacterium]
MYDYKKLDDSFTKYMVDFKPDGHIGMGVAAPGKLYEILDYKLYAWPGHGVPANRSYQAKEGEYMMADEYDDLIQDPTNFFLTKYFPRIFGALEPLAALSPMTNILEMYGGFTAATLIPFGVPPVQEALKKLMAAGDVAMEWVGTFGAFGPKMAAMGYPSFFGGGCKAPFDVIGDTLRGTKGIIMDMYRQPDKLLESLEAMTPIMIKMGASACLMNATPICFIPLHKGADGFMSDAQFKKFYWPTLKKLIEGLIAEGCVPFPWAEGGYSSRLNDIGDVPKGMMMWGFDDTDMAKAKKALGGVSCVTGNISSRVLQIGTVEDTKNAVKKLIDDCAPGGGYLMMNGASLDDCKADNLKAMIDYTKEYGKY